MKKIIKKIYRVKFIQKCLAWLIFLYLHLVYLTSKKQIVFDEAINREKFQNQNAIFAFWHGRLALMSFACNKVQMNVLSSLHPDGRVIARAMELFDFKIIDGSSSKKAFSAFKKIIERCKCGESIAITPDGPRGPGMKINASNIIKVAYKTKLSIYPVTYSAKRVVKLNTWDKFLFPLPFNNLCFMYGAPIDVADNFSENNHQNYKKYLESNLNNLCYKADRLSGLVRK